MNHRIVINSPRYFVSGLFILVGSILAGIWFQSFWPLLLILVGLPIAFRLEREPAEVKRAALVRRGAKIQKVDKEFYGIFGRYWVHGTFNETQLDLASLFLEHPAHETETTGSNLLSPDALNTGLRAWLLSGIENIHFSTDGNSFTMYDGKEPYDHFFLNTGTRDYVLKPIKSSMPWIVEQKFRKVFKFNFIAALLCAAVIYISMALVFTSLGMIQVKQLPLANWNDLQKARGRGRGMLTIWVVLCEAFLFILNNLHPALAALLGVACSIGFGMLLYQSQWEKAADTVWRNANVSG